MTPCEATQHDTASAYNNHGCRCDKARRACSEQKKDAIRRGRANVSAVGTRRRLQALAATGYSAQFLADRIGLDKANLWQLRGGRRSQVSTRIRQAVCDLYDELSGTPGPSALAARHARAKGWAPTTATYDVDTVAVERVLGGDRLRLNPAEQTEVARQLVQRGQGVGRIGQVLHVNNKAARRLLDRVSGACA